MRLTDYAGKEKNKYIYPFFGFSMLRCKESWQAFDKPKNPLILKVHENAFCWGMGRTSTSPTAFMTI